MSWHTGSSLQDVADRAGVSRSTASNALTNKGRVAPATIEAVKKAAAELNYQVNLGARFLRQARTGAVGLYLHEGLSGFDYYMNLAFGVVEAAREVDYSVTLLSPHESHFNLTGLSVDGFIVIDVVEGDTAAEQILSGTRPVVSSELVSDAFAQPAGTVSYDHEAALNKLLNHLYEEGARHVAVLSPPPTMTWIQAVHDAYHAWCRVHETHPRLTVIEHPADVDTVTAATFQMLDSDSTIDAIVSISDGSGPRVISAVKEAGRTIGTDMLVAAYLDSAIAQYTDPPLTALDANPRGFGRELFELFYEIRENSAQDRPVQRVIDDASVSLIVRESSVRTHPNRF